MSRFLSRFLRRDDGHATIEFAIMIPIFLIILLSAVELGIMTMRYAFLERSLDIVVREIRLSTGVDFSHDVIKDRICEEAPMIPECAANLSLEMVMLNPRAWAGVPQNTVCTNREEEVQPVTAFESGDENQLMVLRACVKMTPLFPTTGLGSQFQKDSAGDYSLVVVNAFVQEPR